MFFPRLRRHAKWMFVLLAIFFAGGFVIFGVGAGGTGVGDIFRGNAGGNGDIPSVKDAREEVAKHPKSAAAYRKLATALQADNQTTESISALESYTTLKPSDTDALRELAGLYLSQASVYQQQAQIEQLQAADLTGGGVFGQGLDLGNGQSIGKDPITQAVEEQSNKKLTAAYSRTQSAYDKAKSTYQRLVARIPEDPSAQLELAQTAQQSGDTATAIAAYQRFVKLAPDDPNTPLVKQQIKQLQKNASGATG
jgi:tetratricopeptide (TPR) repeat protein